VDKRARHGITGSDWNIGLRIEHAATAFDCYRF
jgi:hypothetical protein